MASLSAAIWRETWAAAPAALPELGVEVTAQAMVIPVTPAVAAAATDEERTLRFRRREAPGEPGLVIATAPVAALSGRGGRGGGHGWGGGGGRGGRNGRRRS